MQAFEVQEPKKKRGKIGCWIVLIILMIIILLPAGLIAKLRYDEYQEYKYGGHGFDYMYGYSSTDFTGYHVYDGEMLVTLDHEPGVLIEDVEKMPILDGAEACYPVYAAVAKEIYKDIDKIEEDAISEAEEYFDSYKEDSSKDYYYDWYYNNGRIVSFTNTVVGYDRLIQGEVDLFFGARPSEAQKEYAKYHGVQIESVPIGREAFVFFVENDNPVEDLTADQVRRIYSGEITNWQEVGGKNQKIIAFQRPEESGSQVMMKYFMGEVPLMEPDTMTLVDAMGGVINEVKQYHNEKGAIGYTFQYFLTGLQQEEGVKMLSIDGVYPSVDNIKNGSYPATVNLVCAKLASNDKPEVQQVIDFLLSEDGQYIIEKTGYGPIGDNSTEPIIENEIG